MTYFKMSSISKLFHQSKQNIQCQMLVHFLPMFFKWLMHLKLNRIWERNGQLHAFRLPFVDFWYQIFSFGLLRCFPPTVYFILTNKLLVPDYKLNNVLISVFAYFLLLLKQSIFRLRRNFHTNVNLWYFNLF